MKRHNKVFSLLMILIMIISFVVPVSANYDMNGSNVEDDFSEKISDIQEPDYENDPLYIKYLNQPMTMAAVYGSSTLTHNKSFAKTDKVYGVDVSYFQSTINWKKVKAAGIDFAIIRVGYRGYGNGALALDAKFKENLENAKAAGVDVGVYFFTQAITIAEAKQEAEFVLKQIKNYSLEMPVYIDMEEISYDYGRFDAANLSYNAKTNICKTFCETIQNAGYRAGVYASKNCLTYHFDGPELAKSYDVWVAHYGNYTNYAGKYNMWQYTGSGWVSGIPTYVDMNVLYMSKAPQTVRELQANGYGTKATLNWSKSPDAHGYAIYVKNLETGKLTEMCKTASNTKTVSIPYERSRFYIKAYYNIGSKYVFSGYSKGISVFRNYLPEVTGFYSFKPTESTVSLAWNKLKDCDGYIVYKYDENLKKYIRVIKTNRNINSYTVEDLNPGTVYKFAVKAFKTVNGKEVVSGAYPSVSSATIPEKVTGFKIAATSSGSVKLSWDRYANANGYIIYQYNTSKKKWARIVKTTTTVNNYTVRNLKPGIAYKFAVKAYLEVNGEEFASSSYPIVTATTNPANVSGFKVASVSANAVKLTWNKTSVADGYIVYRYNTDIKKYARIAKGRNLAFTDKNRPSGTGCKYAIRAYKTVNGKELLSRSYPQLVTSTKPATVNFSVTAGSKKAAIKWSKVTGATGYKVYYKTSANGKWICLKTTTGTSYTKTGLIKGKTYYFTVKAYKKYSGQTFNGSYVAKSVKIK